MFRNLEYSFFFKKKMDCSCRGGFCSNPCKLIVFFGESSPQGFVSQYRVWKSRIFTSGQGLCLIAILAWHLCPTSARDVPHSWLISPWSNHECTTTTHGSSGKGMPCTQVLATKRCGCQTLQATRSSPWPEVKIPKADNTWDGHCPQKATFCGNIIYLSTLEAGHGHA